MFCFRLGGALALVYAVCIVVSLCFYVYTYFGLVFRRAVVPCTHATTFLPVSEANSPLNICCCSARMMHFFRIASELKERCPGVPLMVFARGATYANVALQVRTRCTRITAVKS